MHENLLTKLKRIRFKDILHLFLFLAALLPAAVFHLFRPHIWLLCEYGMEAQDNAFALFRHLRARHPEVDAVYAICDDSKDKPSVEAIGRTVAYGSFIHWVYYLAAEVNISSQKGGKPNAAVCYLFEVVLGWLKNKRVFLQHGVLKDDMPFLYEKEARFTLFTCSALPEYEFVRARFGYPEGVVRLLGLCRFDALFEAKPDDSLILILPTWRMWLQRECDSPERFQSSSYFQCWDQLLNDPAFDRLLEQYGKHALFAVHRNMSAFENAFITKAKNISVCRWDDVCIPDVIRSASVLITDYSSVYMDFAFMKRPVVYYQFDTDQYREGHLPVGYFDYDRDGFGPIAATEKDAIQAIEKVFLGGSRMDDLYQARVDAFFPVRDANNSERTYLAVMEMLNQADKGAI